MNILQVMDLAKGLFINICWGPDAKRGPLKKCFTFVGGGELGKKIANFLMKIVFKRFAIGLFHNFIFMAKQGADMF